MAVYAGIAVAATIVLYMVYYVVVVSSPLDGLRATIAGVLAKRMAGIVILGGGSALVAWLFLPLGPAELGLTLAIPPSTWLWVGGASVVIVIGCMATAHKPENFEVYPEMRVPRWGVIPVAANLVSCSLYMFAYEFLFRGFLLFTCLAAMPAALAIGINIGLYVLAHVPKGPREALGSIPLGVVLCLSAIETGAIWAAVLIHVIMSQLNDYLAVRANPGMRFAFGGRTLMTVLVTGATGYLGQRLAFRLAENGDTVHALCRSPEKAKALTHERIRVFQGDIGDKDSLRRAAAGCRQAYHAAALVSVWAKDPGDYRRVNVGGTVNVLDATVSEGVERIVITSTAGVFGPSEGGLVDEATPRRIPFFNEYESSKAEMHAAVKAKVEQGVHAVIVCPTRVYGPGQMVEGNAVTRMVERYIEGRWRALPGDGRKSGNYVYIQDVVDGHLAAMAKGRPGEAYILGGDNATYRDFFAQLAEVSGRNQRLYPVPIQSLMAFAWTEQKRADWFGRKPLITPSWVRRYNHDWANSSAKAMAELGYGPRRLRDGLTLTVDWLRSMERTAQG